MRICFIGIGSIARRHIRNLIRICRERDIELCIDALSRASTDERIYPDDITHVYTDINDMPREYDAIFLTNPTVYHVDMLINLHDYARHFFIEKPVSSIDSIEKIKGFRFRDGSVYYVACPLRYSNVIRYLKDKIEPQKVMSIRSISSSYLPEWRPGIDYRTTYSAHKEMGGGVGIDLIHEWDYLVFLFGMPTEVNFFSGKISNLEIESDDYAVYIAKYDNNKIVELHLDYFGRKPIRRIEIYSDDETIVGDFITGEIRYLVAGKTVNLFEDRDEYQVRELNSFLDAIEGRTETINNVSEAIKVLQLTQGVIE